MITHPVDQHGQIMNERSSENVNEETLKQTKGGNIINGLGGTAKMGKPKVNIFAIPPSDSSYEDHW